MQEFNYYPENEDGIDGLFSVERKGMFYEQGINQNLNTEIKLMRLRESIFVP